MVRIIATDLDGTLLNKKRKLTLIDKKNKKYIRSFYGDIVLVSGRNPKFCAKVCNCLNIHHNFISLNGAVIVKNGNVIYRQSMKKTALNSLLEFLESYYTHFELLIFDKYDRIISYSPQKELKTKIKHLKSAIKRGRLQDKIIVSNKKAKKVLESNIDIYKAIVYVNENCEDMLSLISKEYNEHFEFFPNTHSIEIAPKGVNKGEALQYLINTTKVKKDEVFVIGDGTNDLSMFNLFKNSFTMNTAKNEIKAKSKHTISNFHELEKYTTLNNNFKEVD